MEKQHLSQMARSGDTGPKLTPNFLSVTWEEAHGGDERPKETARAVLQGDREGMAEIQTSGKEWL